VSGAAKVVRPPGFTHPRLQVLVHAGKEIILFDLRGIEDHDEAVRLAEGPFRVFMDAQRPDKQCLTLVDARETPKNSPKGAQAMRTFAQQNIPYVKASAVVATSAIHRLAVTTIAMFTKRKIRAFEDVQGAMDWLVAQ
jgi:hypothetical protein